MRAWVIGCAIGVACAHPRGRPLPAAGTPGDDGDGELAHASARLLTAERPPEPRIAKAPGAGAFGGTTYGTYRFPPWIGLPFEPARTTRDLPGSIEGTVAIVARPRKTSCGDVPRGAGGVIVAIDHVDWGRELPELGGVRATVGGEVFVRGCAFEPELQLAAPRPAVLSIDAGTTPLALHVASGGVNTDVALGAGGRARVDLTEPLTKISSSAAPIAPAWVIVPSSPYYAITDEAGRYRIDHLPAGELHVTFWGPGDDAPIAVARTVRIPTARGVTRLDVALH